jgi:hypothetical protein
LLAAIHATLLALWFAPRWGCEIARNTGKSPAGKVAVFLFKLDPDVPAPLEGRGNQAAAGTRERIKHQVTGFSESLDDRLQGFDGFLGRVAMVAGVVPWLHVTDGIGGKLGAALGEHIRGFVLVAQEAL